MAAAKRRRRSRAGQLMIADPHTLRRLTDAVEQLHALVGDLAQLLAEPRRRAEAAAATRRAKAEADAAARAARPPAGDGQVGATAPDPLRERAERGERLVPADFFAPHT